MYAQITTQGRMKDDALIIISAALASGGIVTTIISWFLSRKKNTADITSTITAAAASITDTNERLLKTLNSRIEDLEQDVLHLTEQNRVLSEQNHSLLNRLSAIGDLVLKSTGENVAKSDIARLLK